MAGNQICFLILIDEINRLDDVGSGPAGNQLQFFIILHIIEFHRAFFFHCFQQNLKTEEEILIIFLSQIININHIAIFLSGVAALGRQEFFDQIVGMLAGNKI